MNKVLILSSAEAPENMALNERFVANLNQRLPDNQRIEWQNYHNIGLEMGNGRLRAFIVSDDRSLGEFKAVYFKSYFRYHEQAAAIAEALAENRTPFVGRELKHYIPAAKLSQLARLTRAGINVPHTLYMSLEQYVPQFDTLRAKLGEQFVFKAIDGSTGDDNYLVGNSAQLAEIVAANQGKHFIAQNFIANKSDLRVLIVGDEIKLVIERRRVDDSTHLNNTSRGAKARLLPLETLDPELQALSLKAATVMERDVAGVDLMLETGSDKPYVLEVNASPQIASGAYESEKLDVYAEFFRKLAG